MFLAAAWAYGSLLPDAADSCRLTMTCYAICAQMHDRLGIQMKQVICPLIPYIMLGLPQLELMSADASMGMNAMLWWHLLPPLAAAILSIIYII